MHDDGDRCVHCLDPIEDHDDGGCTWCACGMSVFFDDERGDE